MRANSHRIHDGDGTRPMIPHDRMITSSSLTLGTSFSILYLMRGHKVIKVTYDKEQDTFRYHFLVLPCIVLAFLLHNAWTPFEVSSGEINSWTRLKQIHFKLIIILLNFVTPGHLDFLDLS